MAKKLTPEESMKGRRTTGLSGLIKQLQVIECYIKQKGGMKESELLKTPVYGTRDGRYRFPIIQVMVKQGKQVLLFMDMD